MDFEEWFPPCLPQTTGQALIDGEEHITIKKADWFAFVREYTKPVPVKPAILHRTGQDPRYLGTLFRDKPYWNVYKMGMLYGQEAFVVVGFEDEEAARYRGDRGTITIPGPLFIDTSRDINLDYKGLIFTG